MYEERFQNIDNGNYHAGIVLRVANAAVARNNGLVNANSDQLTASFATSGYSGYSSGR